MMQPQYPEVQRLEGMTPSGKLIGAKTFVGDVQFGAVYPVTDDETETATYIRAIDSVRAAACHRLSQATGAQVAPEPRTLAPSAQP